MPYKSKRVCAYPGCGELTHTRYCERHQKLIEREYKQRYERERRDPQTAARYGREWKIIRARYFAAHPLCEDCLKRGIAIPAEHVHHIKPLTEGGTSDECNLMALCRSCHSRIHVEMRNGRG